MTTPPLQLLSLHGNIIYHEAKNIPECWILFCRDSDSERSERKPRYIQNKSKVQSNKRYIRSSPPQDPAPQMVLSKTGSPGDKTGSRGQINVSPSDKTSLPDDSFLYNTPIQTRTGLTLTQTSKDKRRMYRSASSAEIEKSGKVGPDHKSPKLDRSKSASSSSIHQSKSVNGSSIFNSRNAS